MNNSGPTAQIIERDGWKTSLDFVGHRKAITVVVRICSVEFRNDLLMYNIENKSYGPHLEETSFCICRSSLTWVFTIYRDQSLRKVKIVTMIDS